jgi:hypothetical protein
MMRTGRLVILGIRILLLAQIVWLLPGLTGCASRERELPFETIAQENGWLWGRYEGSKSALLILTGSEQVSTLKEVMKHPALIETQKGQLTVYSELQLADVDWGTYFVLMALQGEKGSSGYKVTIHRIEQRAQYIKVYASFEEPRPTEKVSDRLTSPVHAVRIKKDAHLTGQQIEFSLIVDGAPVAQTSQRIP